jgi:TonB family protein
VLPQSIVCKGSFMFGSPYQPILPQSTMAIHATQSSQLAGLINLKSGQGNRVWFLVLSIVAHLVLPVIFILLFIAIGSWILPTYTPPKRLTNDIEFTIVNSPSEKPRDPNTKMRAEHDSRSGGKRLANVPIAQTIRTAGTQTKKTTAHPKTQAVPKFNRPSPVPSRTPSRQPNVNKAPQREAPQAAPPRPRILAPKATNKFKFTLIPNPQAPIKLPSSQKTEGDSGPIVKSQTVKANGSPSGSSSGSNTAPTPKMVPTRFSGGGGGGQPSPSGGPSGQGGSGRYSQSGSPGGGGGRDGVDALAEPDFGPYLSELQRRIKRSWVPPEARDDKVVVLFFVVNRNGTLASSVSIRRSSGNPDSDRAAKEAVENAAPFRPLPQNYRKNTINVEFRFDYNVMRGRLN